MAKYDIVVLGAGPGGYVAAIRAAQLGYHVACVDSWKDTQGKYALGGTCLNVGCIPSKALLESSHRYHELCHDYVKHGINAQKVELDIKKMLSRKDDIVKTLTSGIESLFLKHKIDWVKGSASFDDPYSMSVTDDGKVLQVVADHIIIATGSRTNIPPTYQLNGDKIIDSSGALQLQKVPKNLCVLGGGIIGLELGSVWNRLGAKTTVLVRGDHFLPAVEQQLAKLMYRELRHQGMDIRLGTTISKHTIKEQGVSLRVKDSEGEREELFDSLLISAGRKPNTEKLNTEKIGLRLDEKGFINVDEYCRTNISHIYAIGDVVRGPMLAHKASEEGSAVAEIISGQHSEVNINTIPSVIYTWPELAWVGLTSEQLDSEGRAYNTGSFPFVGNGRAQALGDAAGMVKILSDKHSDEILGAHILGPGASELIAEIVLAMEFKASAEDIARTVHAHPTLSEAVHEAALAVDKRAIHK